MRPRSRSPLPISYGYVTTVDNVTNSWVRFVMPSTDLVTVEFDWRYSGPDGNIWVSSDANINDWAGLPDSENTSAGRSDNLLVDGFDVGDLARDELYDAYVDGEWHRITVEFGPGNNAASPFASGVGIYFGNYFNQVGFNQAVDMRLFKADVGRTGAWTNRSVLGDDNGFTRSNVAETAL